MSKLTELGWKANAVHWQREYDALAARLAEAEARIAALQDAVDSRDRALGFTEVTADSAKPVCDFCEGTRKAYTLYPRTEVPCPMCSADQPDDAHG